MRIKLILLVVPLLCRGADASSGDGGFPVDPEARGHENIEWMINYGYHLTDEKKDLPRVFLVGDSICAQYQAAVAELLEGRVNVTYWASSYCVTSPMYLPQLKLLLSDQKFDVVHFNNGLHTPPSVSLARWKRSLAEAFQLVRKLQPQAKLVWCTSTPLKDPEKTAWVKQLNAAAREVVRADGRVTVDDLFALEDGFDREEYWSDCYHHRPALKTVEARKVADAVLFNCFDETAAVQARIDAAVAAGGGEVVVPAGDHYLGALTLGSGVTLRFAKNCRVIASREISDCPKFQFTAKGASNVTVVGGEGSSIDGMNCYDPKGPETYRGPHAFYFNHCTNLVLKGLSVVASGDYAYKFEYCRGVLADALRAEAGHDGIHFDLCDGVKIVNCDFATGDDCVAGSGCSEIVVSNCVLNSACSPFRLCGKNVLVTDCRVTGPAKHPHRWSLKRHEKTGGAGSAAVEGRRTVGCFYQGYTGDTPHKGFYPGNIVVRNITVENCERFFVSVSGLPAALWQNGRGMPDITFENVKATGLARPAVVVAKPEEPMKLVLKNCSFSFRTPQDCAFFGKNVSVIDEGVKLDGAAKLFDLREQVGYDDIPEFPSWKPESAEQRAKWGLPPLGGK